MTVHVALPEPLASAAGDVLAAAGVAVVAHGDGDPVGAAEAAAGDDDAVALLGPFRSADVAEAAAATAPAGLPLLAPVATWAGLTRDDEPAVADDPADHQARRGARLVAGALRAGRPSGSGAPGAGGR